MNTMQLETVEKPWGWYQTVYQSPYYWTKIIVVNPGEALSLQFHEKRSEFWTPIDPGLQGVINGVKVDLEVGKRYDIMRGVPHRISNPSDYHAVLIEIATGNPTENDITRLEDYYGRES